MRFYTMYEDESKVHLLNHFKHLQAAAKEINLQLEMNVDNFTILVSRSNSRYLLYPQFLLIVDNQPFYTADFTSEVVCFTGWRPYSFLTLSLGEFFKDKLEQKRFFTQHQFNVPEYSFEKNLSQWPAIIKRRKSSFGKGMRGPFNVLQSFEFFPSKGEFLEQFIKGLILKVGYWNQEVVYIEQQPMPSLEGDGKSSLFQLAEKRAYQRDREINLEQLKEVLLFQGFGPEEILLKNQTVLADFRYESDYAEVFSVKEVDFARSHLGFIDDDLMELGERVYAEKIAPHLSQLFYTIDAILTPDNQLFLLEINPNPTVHPLAYRYMLKGAC